MIEKQSFYALHFDFFFNFMNQTSCYLKIVLTKHVGDLASHHFGLINVIIGVHTERAFARPHSLFKGLNI